MTTLAPVAPGRLGDRLEPAAVQTYLAELEGWVRGRKADLDELDAAALASSRRTELTSDMMLSMALWKAVSDRYKLIFATWDGGRVGPTERERLSVLIWGRLDATLDAAILSQGGRSAEAAAAGLAVSLPEACRLSDALAGALRARLALDPAADANTRRIKALRAGLERVRDQIALEPPVNRPAAQRVWEDLSRRTTEVTERAQRGADVGGLLGPLELETARVERDLIVGGARRRDTRDQVAAARELRADLIAREGALRMVAQEAVRTVDPAPRYAVPDVAALGPVPADPDALSPYVARLARVAKAMNHAHDSYTTALAARQLLIDQLDAHVLKAQAQGVATDRDLAAAERTAREVLDRRPTPVRVGEALVTAYRAWLEHATGGRRTTPAAASGRRQYA